MNTEITIRRNDFKVKSGVRPAVVERVCNAILRKIDEKDFECQMDGPHPKLYLSHYMDPSYESLLPYGGKDKEQVYTDEIRLAFQVLQQFGYYIYVYNAGWSFYVSKRPYRGMTKAKREDFLLFID